MSDKVQFEEDNFSFSSTKKTGVNSNSGNVSSGYGHPQYATNEPKGMVGWLIKNGLAKSGNAAQFILVGFVIFNVILTFIIIKFLL